MDASCYGLLRDGGGCVLLSAYRDGHQSVEVRIPHRDVLSVASRLSQGLSDIIVIGAWRLYWLPPQNGFSTVELSERHHGVSRLIEVASVKVDDLAPLLVEMIRELETLAHDARIVTASFQRAPAEAHVF